MLDNFNEFVSDFFYFDCIESVMENFKVLGELMVGILQNVKIGDFFVFGECVGIVFKVFCGLIEVVVQVVYLVGIFDLNSQVGYQGLVDFIQFVRVNQVIQMVCQNLVDFGSSLLQVLLVVIIVVKYILVLCNVCCIVLFKMVNLVVKRYFVQLVKEVVNSIVNLVKIIKVLDGDFFEDNCRFLGIGINFGFS